MSTSVSAPVEPAPAGSAAAEPATAVGIAEPIGALGKRRLSAAHRAAISPLLRSTLERVVIQLRRCTPFSATKEQLRTEADAIRDVLSGTATPTEAQLEVVATVLSTRLSELSTQLRRCENPEFRHTLQDESARLKAVYDALV